MTHSPDKKTKFGRGSTVSASRKSAAVAALFVAAGILSAPAPTAHSQPRPMATKVFNEVGIEQRLGEQVPLDLEFTDESGHTKELADYFGTRPVVLSLVYYKCQMLCPQVLEGLTGTLRTLEDMNIGREFDVLSVSFDHREGPADAVERKKKYIDQYSRPGADENWHFLTGDSVSIKKLADAVGFLYLYDDKTGQFAHASGLMVLTPEGKLSRYLYGIEYKADDLRFSLMDASHEKIGSAVDKLLLLCYHYDPATGKYGLVVTNLLRAGGVLAILIVGGFMWVNIRREKRKLATGRGGQA
jgi:protein SCO1/2